MIALINTTELSLRTELGDASYKHNSMIQKGMKVTGGQIQCKNRESQAKRKACLVQRRYSTWKNYGGLRRLTKQCRLHMYVRREHFEEWRG